MVLGDCGALARVAFPHASQVVRSFPGLYLMAAREDGRSILDIRTRVVMAGYLPSPSVRGVEGRWKSDGRVVVVMVLMVNSCIGRQK